MQMELIKRLEHITLRSELDLKSFSEKFITALGLPQLNYDSENETEWGNIEYNGINYNISRPYEEGTLQEWDDTTPIGCNFGITLGITKQNAFADDEECIFDNLIAKVCNLLATTFNASVYYHRTHIIGTHKNVQRSLTFRPN